MRAVDLAMNGEKGRTPLALGLPPCLLGRVDFLRHPRGGGACGDAAGDEGRVGVQDPTCGSVELLDVARADHGPGHVCSEFVGVDGSEVA